MSYVSLRVLPGVILSALIVAGCSGGASPPAPSSSSGFSNPAGDCTATKTEMGKLVAQGVESDVNAASSGRTLSAEAQARVDRYNALLETYLGKRCHV